MNIDIEVIQGIYRNEMDVGHYVVLHSILNNPVGLKKLWKIRKLKAMKDALIKKDIISEINGELTLTVKGIELLNKIDNIAIENTLIVSDNQAIVLNVYTSPVISFDSFCEELHEQIEQMILKHTKRKNFKNKSGKMLNSSLSDINQRLKGFFKRFGNNDFELIRKAILKYTEHTVTGLNTYPIRLIYFIWNEKNGGVVSEMLDWMNEIIEDEEIRELKTDQKEEDTRKLF